MKVTSILSLAVALCIVSVQAAPSSSSTTSVHKAITTTKAKATTTKAKATTTKAKSTTTKAKATTTKAKATTTKAKTTTTKAKATTTTAKAKTTTSTVKAKTTTTTTTTAAAKPTTPAPKPKDPCSTLAKEGDAATGFLSYNAVRDCYNAQSYKADIAAKTLTSVENLIGNVYVFLDQAKVASKAPFKTPQVDLMDGLKKIKATKYKSDYDFNMALTYLTFSANDGHLAYRNDCYSVATFTQPISLYAPVTKGVQSVQVFYADTTNKNVPKNLVDCVVTTIDGKPALQAIQEFTDRTSAISKDPGVRLNDALASTAWYKDWQVSPGGFSRRWEVPAKASMDYTFQCGTAAPQKVTIPWIVTPSSHFEAGTFKDTKTYWETQCLAPLSPYDNGRPDDHSSNDLRQRINVAPATTLYRERGHIQFGSGNRNGRDGAEGPKVITQATEVATTTSTAFYTLNKNKNVCVAVIATEEVGYFEFDPSDYTQFIDGLQKLKKSGCKKLILDMTNNGGGSVDFAYFVNAVFFPKDKAYFVQDLRSSTLAQEAAKLAIKQATPRSTFDARGYASTVTGKAFKDASMFTKGINQKRGGSTQTYTQKSFFEHAWPFLPLANKDLLPWKASDMAIVTNGFCGSACTMIATRFNIAHKVKTYAIGGLHKTPLSYFSFPGGFVMDNYSIVRDLRLVGYKGGKTTPISLPLKAATNVAVGEIYATENSTVPLEYDTKYFAASVHLDQDSVSARHPDQTWLKIAADFK
ncbi:hypothetical protein BGX30_011913 [Mortierella sp. GBA39]|nr:hypothetical protein BGX30_011913 [Mortierella sp. GBA39]